MTYRNKTDQDLMVPNIGVVKAGETIETSQKIENSNFEEISSQNKPSDEIKPTQSISEASKKEDDK